MDKQTSHNPPPASPPPSITSFVIRFVSSEFASLPTNNLKLPEAGEAVESTPPYRGTIRHVQSDLELSFSRWEDAVKFIQRFISL